MTVRRTVGDKTMEQDWQLWPRGALLYSEQSALVAPDFSPTVCGEVGEDRLDNGEIQGMTSSSLCWKMP